MAEALWEGNWWEQMEPPPEPEPVASPRAGQGAVHRPAVAGPRNTVRPHPATAERPSAPAAAPAGMRPVAVSGTASAVATTARPQPAKTARAPRAAPGGVRPSWPQIVRIFTASRLLDIQSRLRTDGEWKASKILWIVGTHGGTAPSTQLYAYCDPVVALDVADSILQGTFATRYPAGRQALRIFGGSPQGDDGPIARVLTLAYDGSKQNPYIFSVAHYRGRVESNGRISPVAEQKLGEVSILMGEAEARKVAYHLRAYIVPWMEAMALQEIRQAATA
ncbi:hypothetical protein [Thermaerobacter litoralis]